MQFRTVSNHADCMSKCVTRESDKTLSQLVCLDAACMGDVVAQWLVVSTSDLGAEGRDFESVSPNQCTHLNLVFLGKTLEFSQCFSPPSCMNGNQQIALAIDNMLRGYLRWTSIPSRGSSYKYS